MRLASMISNKSFALLSKALVIAVASSTKRNAQDRTKLLRTDDHEDRNGQTFMPYRQAEPSLVAIT